MYGTAAPGSPATCNQTFFCVNVFYRHVDINCSDYFKIGQSIYTYIPLVTVLRNCMSPIAVSEYHQIYLYTRQKIS